MKTTFFSAVLLLCGTASALAQVGPAMVGPQTRTITACAQVLSEIMTIPARAIPRSLLADAQAIAIVPGMIKGGFVVGVRRGHGVVVSRDAHGTWKLPEFITITGGSVGWQVGVESIDLILVFRTQRSLMGLAKGKFTLGADAAVAAGPVGRNAAAATDLRLKAEILSYSRSRGLFVGVALDGSVIDQDRAETDQFYRPPPGSPPPAPWQPQLVPAEALSLVEQIAQYAGPPLLPPAPGPTPVPAPAVSLTPATPPRY